ncbi:MAG: GvpL/GvpF family gas vesicle protein [Streptomycetaceae bacterium]|nr:GvpL/GvpF family gas vesicle protein [Streptomycetaceae bacterium]
MRAKTSAIWLYAVVPAAQRGAPAGLTGVAGEPVRLITGERLSVLVGDVPLSDFDHDPLRDHLEDLRWLEEAARAHHRVIDAAARSSDVVPLRFATLYHDEAAVRAVLSERLEDFTSALQRIAGRTEWGVKAYVDPDMLAAPADEPESDQNTPGTAYLRRRRAQRQGQRDARQRAAQRAEEIHTALADLAVGALQHPPQDARLAAYRGWMILNGSYLVDDERAQEFAAAVDSCDQRFPEVRLELSGPWPAYSFTTEDRERQGEQS